MADLIKPQMCRLSIRARGNYLELLETTQEQAQEFLDAFQGEYSRLTLDFGEGFVMVFNSEHIISVIIQRKE